MKLYRIKNCDSCEAVVIPEDVNVDVIYVDDKEYTGFIPENAPVLQIGPGFNVNADHFINSTLVMVKQAQDGVFRK